MSETTRQSDWNGVYYDRQAGEFFVMDVGEDGVTLIEAFTGDEYETLGFPEFEDCARNDDFEEVSTEVLRDPAETAEQLLYEAANAVSGGSTSFAHFSPTDVDFAITATNLAYDDDAPYRDRLEE